MIQRLQDDDVLKGLLVFAPFFPSVTSLIIGLYTGLLALILILFPAPIFYFCRKLFILPQQRLVFVLILGISWILIVRMLLDAEAYSLADNIGLFLPLLLMNSLILFTNESILSMPDLRSVLNRVFKVALAALLFFIMLGLLRELLNDVSIFTSSAGFFFLSGFIFAAINFFNRKFA
jgi:electron transport complex protein RnfE